MKLQELPHSDRLSMSSQLTLSLLWFALNFQSAALLPILLPAQIVLFIPGPVGNARQAAFLGWLSAVGAIVALIVPPIVGLLSDRTSSTWGRRKPYIVASGLLLLLSAFVLAASSTIWIFVAGFLIFMLANNAGTAAYQGLLPDLVPLEQRGSASGYMGLMTILGSIGSPALATWLIDLNASSSNAIHAGSSIYYVITGLVLIVCVLITIFGIHEAPHPVAALVEHPGETRIMRLQHWLVENWLAPWRDHDFAWVFLSRCCVMLGLYLFMTFIEYYFANVAQNANFIQATAVVTILALLGAVGSTLVLGMLSDRLGRVMIVCLSTGCMALAALMFVLFPGTFPLWPLGLLFGVGYGAYSSVDWALAVDALPSLQSAGRDLGLWTIAMTLPAVAAPLIGSGLIFLTSKNTQLGYRLVFAVAAIALVLGAIMVMRVHERVASPARARPARRTAGFGWQLAFRSRAGRARGFLLFWPLWERFTLFIWSVKPVPGTPHALLFICFKRYHGRPIDLPEGVHVQSGDTIGELHFRNQGLLDSFRQVGPWGLMHRIAEDMHALALWSQTAEFPSEVRAIYGATLLSRGARRLGFTVRESPRTLHTHLERFFLLGLLVLYHQDGLDRLMQGTTYDSYQQEVWMSREALQKRYTGS